MIRVILLACAAMFLSACGEQVEVPPAHVGKIMTSDGYNKGLVPISKFRLAACWTYCDKLVLLDISDKAQGEAMTIFMPEDKLNVELGVQVTLSINPSKVEGLFSTLSPQPTTIDSSTYQIDWASIYKTYASQVVQTETREYISQYSIAQMAGQLEKVNLELREALTKRLEERTPFNVRYVGITTIKYPAIITEAQENAAERRERIQQEEAQLQISKVTLERELQEAQLKRKIDLEKAETEARAQEIQREVVDDKVFALRRIENERAWIEKWDGKLPATVYGENAMMMVPPPK